MKTSIFKAFLLLITTINVSLATAQSGKLALHFKISIPSPEKKSFHVQVDGNGWEQDTITFKMPRWMPGYYQIMDYGRSLENFVASGGTGKQLVIQHPDSNTWKIVVGKQKTFRISYDIKTQRKFVATNFVDSAHAYILPVGSFMYVPGHLNMPVTVQVINTWRDIATGLEPVQGKKDHFSAPDFDVLYDCPILLGNLDEFPAFEVQGIKHRFIAYNPGNFNKQLLMENLKKIVEASVAIIGDIPYKQYTFIGIGPGQGGIEHLNNTTVSFNGNGLNTPEAMNRILNFLAHEYFHHYNVKRIRPVELGPFDYDRGSKTNLLWVSEGLSVYYEYLVVKRAGLSDERTLLSNFERNINAFENGPGKSFQSLSQASYETWSTGPFGRQGKDADRSISYYDKGPIVGLLLDFAIRNETKNERSLDDVMRLVYWKYYKKLQRGFSDAEFQAACEEVAGTSLKSFFDYVYTATPLDYEKYLGYAGLKMEVTDGTKPGEKKYTINRVEGASELAKKILGGWLTGQ